MPATTPVEIADRISRKRPIGLAAAALVFLLVQVVAPPFFAASASTGSQLRQDFWAINAVLLIMILATGGAVVQPGKVRALLNDEVARSNARNSVWVGFGVAMATAMAIYLIPALRSLTARETVYLVVTSSVATAVLLFAWKEHRDSRDA